MLEDRLTHAERIRLESLSQAIGSAHLIPVQANNLDEAFDKVVARAEKIEAWLRAAREDA